MNKIAASLLITLQFLTAIIFGQVNVKLLPVRVDGKWGYIDTTGSVIIKPKFDKAQFFTNDDYAVISKDGLVGIIDLKGTMILEPYYEDLKIIDENRIGFRKDSLWGMIDKSGKMIMPLLFNDINKIEENHYTVRLGNKYGIIDNMGKVLVKPYYDGVIPFSNSFFISVSGNFKGLHNFNGQQLLSTECEEIISVFDDYIMYKVNGLWGCINIDGQILVEPKWITYKALNKHFIKLLKNGKWSLYCTASQKLISDTLHQNFYHFNQDYVQYFYENRFGILDKNGDNVLQPLYYEIAPTSIHLFKTKTMGGWGLVKKGDIRVVSNEYDEIGDFYSNVTKVSQNEFYGLINSRGSVLAATKYTNIEMVNNVVKAYRGKERKVIYINDNGNIINKSDYKNVLSIYVGSKKITNPRAVIQRTVMKSSSDFGWYVCPSSGKWGLKNNKSDYNIVPPEYDYITVNSELGLTLVEVRSNNKYVLGDKEFSVRSRYGLVDHINGKFLAGPNFWEIRWEDFLQGDDHVARCIRMGGKHGIMKRNGNVLYGKSTYIDDFINGYARFNIGGKLTCTSKDTREVLSSVNHYSENMKMVIRNPGQELQSLWLKCEGGKWGYMDVYGNIVVGVQYDFADVARNSTFIVRKNSKWGTINLHAQEQIPLIYHNIEYLAGSENNLFFVEKNDKKIGFINTDAEIIAPARFDESRQYHEGMVAVRINKKWGFLDDKGKLVIDTIFDSAKDFNNGLAPIKVKRRWGYVDKQGNITIDTDYMRAENFSEELAAVRIKGSGGFGYVNTSGEIVIPGKFLKCAEFQNGVAKVKFRGRYGVIDKNGKWVVNPNYKKISMLDNELIVLKKGTSYGLVKNDGTRLLRTKHTRIGEFNDGLARVKTKRRYQSLAKRQYTGFVDTNGQMVIPAVYKSIGDFHDGLAIFREKGKYGYIDQSGVVVIQPKFHKADDFSNGLAVVTNDGHFCLIDTKGKIVYKHPENQIIGNYSNGKILVKDELGVYFIDVQSRSRTGDYYEDATDFYNGKAKVKLNDKWAMIDKNGFYFFMPKFDEIEEFTNGKARVKCSHFIGISDKNGKMLASPIFDKIQYLNSDIYKVERNNEVGYLAANGKWVWEPRK